LELIAPHKRTKPKPGILDITSYKLASLSRQATGYLRVLPDFIIIGAAKAGTTSLYNYLIQHPGVLECFRKEVHYFDKKYANGLNWYKSHFPLRTAIDQQPGKITGESSPYYLYHPQAPVRIAKDLPGRKFICLLRDPIDRAVSNYNHRVRAGFENMPIELAFEKESERIKGEHEKLLNDSNYISYAHYHFSYQTRGNYAEQLKWWYQHIPKEDILVLKSESFYENSKGEFEKVLSHLNLPWHDDIAFKVYNSGGGDYKQVNPELRRNLQDHFSPMNEELYELIGERFNWEK